LFIIQIIFNNDKKTYRNPQKPGASVAGPIDLGLADAKIYSYFKSDYLTPFQQWENNDFIGKFQYSFAIACPLVYGWGVKILL
jgi:hypothetical protein